MLDRRPEYTGQIITMDDLDEHIKKCGVERSASARHALLLVIDCSSSMGDGDKMDQARRGATSLLSDALGAGYAVGVVTFSTNAAVVAAPTTDSAALGEVLRDLSASGSTNLAQGLTLGVEELRRVRGFKSLIVVTDGMPDSKDAATKAASEARRQGIQIVAVGTDDADSAFLAQLATRRRSVLQCDRAALAETISKVAGLLGTPSA